ncbi:MAG: hypothetical protein SGPRY_014834 [Prymnesium sp.]
MSRFSLAWALLPRSIPSVFHSSLIAQAPATLMDFTVTGNANDTPATPALSTARGADPLVSIPNPHFFRRIRGLHLVPPPNALAPIGTSLHLSVVESVLGPALRISKLQPTIELRPWLYSRTGCSRPNIKLF